jgi:hypothetical protein
MTQYSKAIGINKKKASKKSKKGKKSKKSKKSANKSVALNNDNTSKLENNP